MSLEAFAEDEEKISDKKTRCMTCNLPPEILEEVHAGRSRSPKPVSFPLISRWLKAEHQIDLTQATIRNHFVAGHHDKS